MGHFAPVFEISETAGNASDMLVRDSKLGEELARSLGSHTLVLMRGHGSTVVGQTVGEAVFTAVYAEINARLQTSASPLGDIRSLTKGEVTAATEANASQIDRTWDLWLRDTAPDLD